MATVFKILKKGTETYLKGTPAYNSYDKSGRIFQSIGKLRAFLTSCVRYNRPMSDWLVIEYDLTVKETKSVSDVVTAKTLVKILTK